MTTMDSGTRVIDELMGQQARGRAGRQPANAIGAHHRHTTPEMAARVVAAVEQGLEVVLVPRQATFALLRYRVGHSVLRDAVFFREQESGRQGFARAT